MTKDQRFQLMKKEFEFLAKYYGVLTPIVTPALPTDPCDVTDPPYVRINLNQRVNRKYQLFHLFGHYLADLHAMDEGKYSEDVADAVAYMLRAIAGFK